MLVSFDKITGGSIKCCNSRSVDMVVCYYSCIPWLIIAFLCSISVLSPNVSIGPVPLTVALGLLGKMAVSITACVCFLYVAELYPTTCRWEKDLPQSDLLLYPDERNVTVLLNIILWFLIFLKNFHWKHWPFFCLVNINEQKCQYKKLMQVMIRTCIYLLQK